MDNLFNAAFVLFWALTVVCFFGALISFVKLLGSRQRTTEKDSIVLFYMFRDSFLNEAGRIYRKRLIVFLGGFAFSVAAGFVIAVWKDLAGFR